LEQSFYALVISKLQHNQNADRDSVTLWANKINWSSHP